MRRRRRGLRSGENQPKQSKWQQMHCSMHFPGNTLFSHNSGTPDLSIRTSQGGGLEGGGTQNARETQRFWQAAVGADLRQA